MRTRSYLYEFIAFSMLCHGLNAVQYFDVNGDGINDRTWDINPNAHVTGYNEYDMPFYEMSVSVVSSVGIDVSVAGVPVTGTPPPTGWVPGLACAPGTGGVVHMVWWEGPWHYFGNHIAYEEGPTLDSLSIFLPSEICIGRVYSISANFWANGQLFEGNSLTWSGDINFLGSDDNIAYVMFLNEGQNDVSATVDQGVPKGLSVIACAEAFPESFPTLYWVIATAGNYVGESGPIGEPSWVLSDYQLLIEELGWTGFQNLPESSQLHVAKTVVDIIRYYVLEGLDPTARLEQEANGNNCNISDEERYARAVSLGTVGMIGLENRGFRPPTITRVFVKDVPSHWRIVPSKKGGGVRYIDPSPTNKGNSVRIMPGNPNSPHPNSQVPYARWTKNGQYLDKHGNVVSKNAPEGHIPLDEFVFDPTVYLQ